MGFDYEPEFEDALIKLLKNNGWSGKMLNYPTEEQLIKNWADILFNNNKGGEGVHDGRAPSRGMVIRSRRSRQRRRLGR